MATISLSYTEVTVGSAKTFKDTINENFRKYKVALESFINETIEQNQIVPLQNLVSSLQSEVATLEDEVDQISGDTGKVGSWNQSVLGTIADRLGGGANGNSGTERRVIISDGNNLRSIAKTKDFIFEVYTV